VFTIFKSLKNGGYDGNNLDSVGGGFGVDAHNLRHRPCSGIQGSPLNNLPALKSNHESTHSKNSCMEKAAMLQALVGFSFAGLILVGGIVMARRADKKNLRQRSK
jgi:hypothetical protein